MSNNSNGYKRIVRELVRRRSNARKTIESAKYLHIRERAKGRLAEIENTLLAMGYTEAATCK